MDEDLVIFSIANMALSIHDRAERAAFVKTFCAADEPLERSVLNVLEVCRPREEASPP